MEEVWSRRREGMEVVGKRYGGSGEEEWMWWGGGGEKVGKKL